MAGNNRVQRTQHIRSNKRQIPDGINFWRKLNRCPKYEHCLNFQLHGEAKESERGQVKATKPEWFGAFNRIFSLYLHICVSKQTHMNGFIDTFGFRQTTIKAKSLWW